MHPEDEGIYETADPDRGSNTRGETPDCERYCKTLRHEKSYGFISSSYSLSLRHIIGSRLYHSLYHESHNNSHISDKDGACVVVCEKKMKRNIDKADTSE